MIQIARIIIYRNNKGGLNTKLLSETIYYIYLDSLNIQQKKFHSLYLAELITELQILIFHWC